ncbi:MAG: hypothetical protein HYS71_00890, partial [Candidatus Omnitrophica bacterium]|nr:hypothetical protein [Candidatus Omnitrophota bacterium]
ESERDELSDAEKRDLIMFINEGTPLPEKYRFLLFEDKREGIPGNSGDSLLDSSWDGSEAAHSFRLADLGYRIWNGGRVDSTSKIMYP